MKETVKEEIVLFDRKVLVYGVWHTADPKDRQISLLLKNVESYKPDALFIEKKPSFVNKWDNNRMDELLKNTDQIDGFFFSTGVIGLAALKAYDLKIPVYTLDLNSETKIRIMVEEEGLRLEEVFLFECFTMLRSWKRIIKELPDEKDRLGEGYISMVSKVFNDVYPEFNSSYEVLKKLVDIKEKEMGSFQKVYDFYTERYDVDSIGYIDSKIREKHFWKKIERNIKKYAKCMIIIGNDHATELLKMKLS
jgi:hypothetical protein